LALTPFDLACHGVDGRVIDERMVEEQFSLGESLLDRCDDVKHVRGRRHVSVDLVFGPVVPARRDPPRATTDCFVFGEIELPDLVRPGRFLRERGLATLREIAAFTLIVSGKNQPLVADETQHGSLRNPVTIVAGHRSDFPVAPRRMRPRVLHCEILSGLTCGLRPWTLRRSSRTRFRLPAPPGPFGHVDQQAEPRGRHARLDADPLEVLEGPKRPSAFFFHIRISTAASPSAWVSSATDTSP
jgi:hypothetical protein